MRTGVLFFAILMLPHLSMGQKTFASKAKDASDIKANTKVINFALVPGQDSKVLEDQGEILANYLQKETGLKFKISVPYNFVMVVETLGSKRTDMAFINSFGYLLAHEKYNVRARLMGTTAGRTQYWGQFITAKSDIKTLKDLEGKKIAYVDPASTSGFILPSITLSRKNIKPKEFIFAGKHDSVVTAVYLGQVDAGATFYSPEIEKEPQDARRLVKTQFPDVYQKVRIIELTDPIPIDPIVFREDFPKSIENKIAKALKKFSKTKEGPKVLKSLYNITGFRETNDKDYDPLRKILKDIGKSPDDFLKK